MARKNTSLQSKQIAITPARRIGRFFGYFGVLITWLILLGIALSLIAAVPAIILADAPQWSDTGAILSASPGIVNTIADPIQFIPAAIALWLLALVYGYVVLYWLPGVTLINTLLSAIYVGRSLNPRYKDEPLSSTRLVNGVVDPRFAVISSSSTLPLYKAARWLIAADVALGQSTGGKTAVSLLPVRGSRVATFLGNASLAVWGTLSLPLIRALWWLGATYWVTLVWALWPVHGILAVTTWAIISVVLLGYSIYRIARAIWLITQSSSKQQRRRAQSAQ